MKKRRYLKNRGRNTRLAIALVVSMCISPLGSNLVYAADENDTVQQTEISGTQEPTAGVLEDDAAAAAAIENESELAESEAVEAALAAEDVKEDDSSVDEELSDGDETEEAVDPIPDKTPHLVYGDENLADEDAYVLFMSCDGFTADQQDTFYSEAERIAEYVMDTSPWDEFADTIKIYAMGVISNESGSKADSAKNQEEAEADTRDTYFGSQFWSGGTKRLVTITNEGRTKLNALVEEYCPSADCQVVIVNSDVYGGSGGNYCIASLNNESLEMMLHELGHTIGKLSDEYFAGASYAKETANMTAESDPEKVKWARFVGKNGVDVYEYDNGGDGWYRPSQYCKMRYLGKQYEYCEVCKEGMRQAFSAGSNVTKLFFQTYADEFYESDTGKDMSEYFILRRGDQEITGDELGDKLTLVYKDSNGEIVDGIPSERGTYTVEATYAGDATFDACTQVGTYTIDPPDLMTLNVDTKVYDGQPAEITSSVDYEGEYTIKDHYTGLVPYAAEITYDYDSDEAPIKPGRYTVTRSAYDADGNLICKKSKYYEITFKSTALSNNDSTSYPGAQPYYNNKTIVFTGEGFTADEQDEFEAIAKKYVEYFRNTEPYKEADLYFNYHTVEAVSNESGISSATDEKDTYFQLKCDENGKITAVDGDVSTDGAMYVANNVVTSYYTSTIVIVNDKDNTVKEGATVTNKRFIVYSTPDEDGMAYAASELLNYFTGDDEGYRATTTEEKATQRTQLLKALFYTWYGTDYAPILSSAYNEEFVENGEPVDLSSYFNAYIHGKKVDGMTFTMTYYTDNNGEIGEKLDSAPSTAGTYHACAEYTPADGAWKQSFDVDGTTYNIPKARGWTTFTIKAKEAEVTNPSDDKTTTPSVDETTTPSDDKVTTPSDDKTTGTSDQKVTKPKGTSVSKLVKGKKQITVKWKKQTKGITGYQIQYSTKSSFKGAKTVTVSKKKTSSTIKKLKSKKTYYVRIRTYKTTKVNGKTKKVYSSWSKAKSVKTK